MLKVSILTFSILNKGEIAVEQRRKIFFELNKTSRNIKRLLDTGKNKPYIDKITGNHGHIIGFLYENREKDLYQKDVEKKFNIRPSTASNMLRTMEKNGLIERKSSKDDARLKRLVLTKKSLDIQEFIMRDFDEFNEKMCEGISEEELQLFFSVLDKINSNIKEVENND